MNKQNQYKLLLALALTSAVATPASWAGPNDYFSGGPILPGAVGSEPDDTPNGPSSKSGKSVQAAPATAPTNGPGTAAGAGFDNTSDEKRMQKKYKANMNRMKGLIAKGDAMMKAAPKQDDKMYKKGKILKEMGEKHLADMQSNSPFNFENLENDKKKEAK